MKILHVAIALILVIMISACYPITEEQSGAEDTSSVSPSGGSSSSGDVDHLAVVSFEGLTILNISDPYKPKVIGHTTFQNPFSFPINVQVEGDYAYVMKYDFSEDYDVIYFSIYDLKDESSPKLLKELPLFLGWDGFYGLYDMHIDGIYAYITSSSSGLVILDIHDPENLQVVGTVQSVNNYFYRVYVSENYAYIVSDKGLILLDVKDKENPTVVSSLTHTCFWSDVYVVEDYVYVADFCSGMVIVDVGDKKNPKIVGQVVSSDCDDCYEIVGIDVYVEGDFAYLLGGDEEDDRPKLFIIDVSKKENPKVVGRLTLTNDFFPFGFLWGSENIFVKGDYVYLSSDDGLFVVDVKDKEHPKIVKKVGNGWEARDVFYYDDYIFVANFRGGLTIIDGSDKFNPRTVVTLDTKDARGVFVSDDYAFIADADDGLIVVNVRDVTNPVITGQVHIDSAYSVYVENDYAFLAGRGGLTIVDVSDKGNPNIVGSLDIGDKTFKIYVNCDYAFMIKEDGLVIVDVADKKNPKIVKSMYIDEARDVFVKCGYAFVTAGDKLLILDVSDKSNPEIIGSKTIGDYVLSVYVSGDYAFVTGFPDGLYLVNVTDKKNPEIVAKSSFRVFDNFFDDPIDGGAEIYVHGDYAYIADGVNGLVIFDVGDKGNPKMVSDMLWLYLTGISAF